MGRTARGEAPAPDTADARLGVRLAELGAGHGRSRGELTDRGGSSRATLAHTTRAATGPTATQPGRPGRLDRLSQVAGRTMSGRPDESRTASDVTSEAEAEAESEPASPPRSADRPVAEDPARGFVRRSVAPQLTGRRAGLAGAGPVPGTGPARDRLPHLAHDRRPVPGPEQLIRVLGEATRDVTVPDTAHRLDAGDCSRTRAWGPRRFRCAGARSARYAPAVVLP